MDKALVEYIKKHSGMPLPELKLELMKQGFSSYQIEQALKEIKAKRIAFFRSFVILLVVVIVFVIIGIVFLLFIKPAEELTRITIEQETAGQKWVALPSERPSAPEKPFVEEIVTEEKEQIVEQVKISEQIPSKTLEQIRKLSDTEPNSALQQCGLLENKDECISLVAKNTNTPVFCEKIEDSDIKDNCFLFFGQSNEGFCASILDASVRSSCYALAEINKMV